MWLSVGLTTISREFPIPAILDPSNEFEYYRDQMDGKPWVDASKSAMKEFYLAQSSWLPSWGTPEERGMIVKSVKMWELGACA
jgi:hypothetical protein